MTFRSEHERRRDRGRWLSTSTAGNHERYYWQWTAGLGAAGHGGTWLSGVRSLEAGGRSPEALQAAAMPWIWMEWLIDEASHLCTVSDAP
jgi:hypothetical protein